MPVGSARTEALPGAGDRELHLTRVFDAPRRLVFEAWTDPKQVALWWGPHGFTNPVCALDVRPGGAIRIGMRGPDGHAYPMSGVFREIARPDRLVFSSAALDDEGRPLFEVLNTVTFAERGGRTTVTARARVVRWNPEAPPYLEGMKAGWTQTLERLGAHVAKREPGGREVVLSRLFDAPRRPVFEAWTRPEHLVHWWGRHDFTLPVCEVDLRPAGAYRFCMRTPEGRDFWVRGVYWEIADPERLVFTCGLENEGPSHDALWTVTLSEEGTKTKLTVHQILFDREQARGGAREGLNESLDRLAAYMAKGGEDGERMIPKPSGASKRI